MDNKAKEVLLGHSSSAELKSTNQSAHKETKGIMSATAVDNGSHKGAGIFYDPSANATSQSSTQDKKEAVAALSASLAFRRFDNGGTNSTSVKELDSSLASRDSLDDSLRQFKESILRSGSNNTSSSSGKVMTPLRRSFQGYETSSIRSALSLRRSLPNNSYHSGHHIDGDIQDIDFSDDDDDDDDEDNDNSSLNSHDLKKEVNGRGRGKTDDKDDDKEESMTISILESKRLSSEYSHLDGTTASSDDSDDSTHANDAIGGRSNASLDLEADDLQSIEMDAVKHLSSNSIGLGHHPATTSTATATLGFVSSLQRIFDSSQDGKIQQQNPGTTQFAPSSASLSSNKNHTSISSSSSLSKSQSCSKSSSNKESSSTTIDNNNKNWSNRIYPIKQPKKEKRKIKVSNSNNSLHSMLSKGSNSSFGKRWQKSSYQGKLAARVDNSNNHNSSWKDASLSSILKHHPHSLSSAKHSPKRLSSQDSDGHRRKPRTVSWSLDNDHKMSDMSITHTNKNNSANASAHKLGNSQKQQRNSSLLSQGDESIDLDEMLKMGETWEATAATQSLTPPPKQQRTSLATSLEADEELLASMIHLAQHLGDSSGSWGNHVSLSSGNDYSENGSNTAAKSEGQAGDVAKLNKSTLDRGKEGSEEADKNTASPTDACVANNDVDNTLTASKTATTDNETTKTQPMQQEQLGDKMVRQPSTTSAAVTRLVYQEVEDYRTRLQRKRASMEMMEAGSTAATSNNNISGSNGRASSSSQAEELNELLLENATSISNALLLQRALYSLGIHASDTRPAGAVTGNDGGNSASRTSSNGSQGGASMNVGDNPNATIPRAHSEHTGINRMALNHLRQTLSGSGTTPTRRESPSTNTNITSSSPPPESNNAQWNTFSSATASNNSSNSSNPFTAMFNRRRFTYQEGAEPAQTVASPPQIGAYHSNEPAPLLFRRTFNANAPNRRASRAEARRNTLETLAMEDTAREVSASAATRNRSCPATMFETDIFDDDNSSSSSEDGTYARSPSLTDQANVRNSSSTIVVSNTTLASPPTTTSSNSNNVSPTGQSAGLTSSSYQGSSFRPASIAPTQTSNRPRVGSQLSSTTTNRSSLISSTNTRESIRSIGWNDLEEQLSNTNLNESDGTPTNNNNSNSSELSRQGLRSYLMASVRRQSYNSRRMIQAILVSDEIVEAIDCSTHENNNNNDVEMEGGEEQQSEIQARLAMMEELLEEQDEEQRRILERYYQRERILIVLVTVSVAVIIALVVVIIVV